MGDKTRQLGLQFRQEQKTIHVSGYVDEFADYGPLLSCPPPLKLNVRGIRSVNSIGARKWMEFIRTWGIKSLEFHECSVVFIESANFVPNLISGTGNMRRIKSVVAPFLCPVCNTTEELVVQVDEIKVADGEVTLPPKPCSRCRRPMDVDLDVGDHFLFLSVKGLD